MEQISMREAIRVVDDWNETALKGGAPAWQLLREATNSGALQVTVVGECYKHMFYEEMDEFPSDELYRKYFEQFDVELCCFRLSKKGLARFSFDFLTNSTSMLPEISYEQLQVHIGDLRDWYAKLIALQNPPQINEPIKALLSNDDESVSPFIKFMLRAARELELDASQRVPKKTVMHWLDENWPSNLEEKSDTKVKYMATFLRWPVHGSGGNFSQNVDHPD